MSSSQPIEVTLAILVRDDRLLMQLRDDIPTIVYPGTWALFGGHMEAGETPTEAIVREILEEINYPLTDFNKFGCYSDSAVIRHVFYAPLKVEIDRLNLQEGWDFGLFDRDTLLSGKIYSTAANSERSIAPVHYQIITDFIEWDGR
jgi:8-oxo-dGTP diphosphatase